MIDIRWSPEHIASLHQLADSTPKGTNPIESRLAPSLLHAAAGEIEHARAAVMTVMAEQPRPSRIGGEVFSHLIAALFATQQFDFAARMFSERYGLEKERLQFQLSSQGPPRGRIIWQLTADRKCTIIFGEALLQHDDTRQQALCFCWLFPLILEYMRYSEAETGAVIVNTWDVGLTPGLAGCANSSEFVLIPDWLFIGSQGYAGVRRAYRENNVPWSERKPIAYWRGTTTGHPSDPKAGWRSLPRVHLCEYGLQHQDLMDLGISKISQVANPDSVRAELKSLGLFRDYAPAPEFNRYRYQIDIDGNTNSWPGLFLKLLTGSPVLKVASPRDYRQWYYNQLVPWHNFVPVATDMSDLADKVRWLIANDDIAQRIGAAGQALGESLDFAGELRRACPTITAALRRFGFDRGCSDIGSS